jgi:hypothetical protein
VQSIFLRYSMTASDLLFLISFLTGAVTLIIALIAGGRGRRARARWLFERIAIGAASYLAILLLVSAFSPQRYATIGDDECSDDWCIAAQTVHRESTSTGFRYDVVFQLSSRARRVDQRERFVAAYVQDERGHRYFPLPDSTAIPFDTLLHAGERLTTVRRFAVPADAKVAGLVIAREGGGRFPACCIIGDEGSLFHRQTIIRLD